MKRTSLKTLLGAALATLLLAGAASAEPTPSSLIVEGPMVAQQPNGTFVPNYSYMRNRRNGPDGRYQAPNTVYRDEYPTEPGEVMVPTAPNDPRFQYRYHPNANGNIYYNPNNPYVRGNDGYYHNPNNDRQIIRDANGNVIQRNGRQVIRVGR